MSGLASIVLVFHIFICIALIGVVLLQRSDGGALGIGGGSGSFMSARGAGNALTRATMVLAAIFFVTSILLSVLSRAPTKELNLQGTPTGKGGPLKPGQAPAPVSLAPGSAKAPNGQIPAPVALQPSTPPAGGVPAPVSLQPNAPVGQPTAPAGAAATPPSNQPPKP